jgi:ADP-ribose pyrophosphatase YjhB (NUDIX family)
MRQVIVQSPPDRLRLRQISAFLQKAPWIVGSARKLWRFFQPKFSAGVVGIVFDSDGRVLLVEHVFHPYAPWGLPGGWVGRNETPAETVARELREELQLDVQVGALVLTSLDFGDHLDFAYIAYGKGDVGSLSQELLNYGWYSLDALPKLHSFHYRAIQRAARFQVMWNELSAYDDEHPGRP